MNVRPLYDHVLVKRIPEAETIRNGIIIPDSTKEKPREAEVLAVGKGTRLTDGTVAPMMVAVGDRVLFGKYAGGDITIEGEECLMLREDEIYGVLSEGKRTSDQKRRHARIDGMDGAPTKSHR